jgi:hypothetical protein
MFGKTCNQASSETAQVSTQPFDMDIQGISK